MANRIVKEFPEKFPNGVYLLDSPEKIEKALKWLKIEDVWGIGRKYTAKLQDFGIYKAWDLLQKPENQGQFISNERRQPVTAD